MNFPFRLKANLHSNMTVKLSLSLCYFSLFTGCFKLATCKPKSDNQNITAYGVLVFVSDLNPFRLM